MTIRLKQMNALEANQVLDRLEALGLRLKDGGVLDPSSAGSVKGGLERIQSLAQDGVLDADAIAKLRQNRNWVMHQLGRDAPISEKRTNAMRALALELHGVRIILNRAIHRGHEEPHNFLSTASEVDRRWDHMFAKLRDWITPGPDSTSKFKNLADIHPSAIRQFVTAYEKLAQSMAEYMKLVSQVREELAKPVDKRPGQAERKTIHSLNALLHSAERLQTFVQEQSDLLSETRLPAPRQAISDLWRDQI